jgi:hypothetical protein
LKRLINFWTFAALIFCGCAHSGNTATVHSYPFSFTNVSQGLPADGLWRQHIALHDMNADGFLEIVTPPARKSVDKYNTPSIFQFDEANNIWTEGKYDFPPIKDYGYGGIAVGDLDNDGRPDIVLAAHTGRIIILRNSLIGSFSVMPFEYDVPFSSRAIAIDDINGDGWKDIIAFSEVYARKSTELPRPGLILGINREGREWESRVIEAGRGISGDSVATGDLNGNGKRDILAAPLTSIEEDKKIVWFNDGKGDFMLYEPNLSVDMMPSVVRAGDINGDGKDEVVIVLSGFGDIMPPYSVYTYIWDGSSFVQTPSQMEFAEMPVAIDLADIDGDGRKEVFVLYRGGIDIFKYTEPGWAKVGHQELPAKESAGVYDLRAGVNRDGSVLVVYNLGNEPDPKVWNNGLKAYIVKPAGRE